MTSIPPKRIPIPTATRTEVLERDNYACQKCGIQSNIDAHHIEMVFDGGTNDPDNLICLCGFCHQEWHILFESSDYIDFDDWLTIPPARIVIGALLLPIADDMTVSDWRTTMQSQMHEYMTAFNAEHPPTRRKTKKQ